MHSNTIFGSIIVNESMINQIDFNIIFSQLHNQYLNNNKWVLSTSHNVLNCERFNSQVFSGIISSMSCDWS